MKPTATISTPAVAVGAFPAKVPLNFFGMPFGLAGLGEVWTMSACSTRSPHRSPRWP